MDVKSWNVSAAAHSLAAPDGAPEGMDKAGVNDTMRETMAAVRRWFGTSPDYRNLLASLPGPPVVSRTDPRTVTINPGNWTALFPAGTRVRVTDGATFTYGYVISASFGGASTAVLLAMEPNLGFGELAAGIQLTFADAGPDTITAASGTPFAGLVAGDRVRVKKAQPGHLNDGIYLVASATNTVITLDAAEALSNEGPVSARIFQESGTVPVGINALEHAVGDERSAAYRKVGTQAGEIPSIGHLGAAAVREPGHLGGIDADTLDGMHADDILEAAAPTGVRNRLVNGSFRRWQRGTSFANTVDATYTADQWKALVQTATGVAMARDATDKPAGARSSLKLTAQAAGGKWGVVQFIEAEDCFPLLGETGVFSVYLKADASIANVRLLLVTWTGTEDGIAGVAPDVVSAWNAAGNNPTLHANVTIEASLQVVPTGAWQRFTISGVFDAVSGKNAGVLVLVDDDAITVGHALWIAQAQLELGSEATPFELEPWDQLSARTHRFFAKTFPEATAPAHGTGLGGALRMKPSSNAANDDCANWMPPLALFEGGAITASLWNPVNAAPAAGEAWRDYDAGVDRGAAVETAGSRIIAARFSTAPTNTNRHAIHMSVEAPLF